MGMIASESKDDVWEYSVCVCVTAERGGWEDAVFV